MRGDAFSAYHPLPAFLFFAFVLGVSMCVLHPVTLAISFGGAAAYLICLRGARAAGRTLLSLLPLMLLAALLNPAFNHRGVTVLGYFPSGNPLTAESIFYGLAAAVRLGAALLWFSCCAEVMTEDKLLHLFGRVSPSLSLLLSMTLRFVPRFHAQLRAVREVRRVQGTSGRFAGVKAAARAFSATTTWALEHGVELSDSMRCRGYGMDHRTAFSLYRMSKRDNAMLMWIFFCGTALLTGALKGEFAWRFYPRMTNLEWTAWGAGAQGVWLALCLTPAALHGREARLWKRSASEI